MCIWRALRHLQTPKGGRFAPELCIMLHHGDQSFRGRWMVGCEDVDLVIAIVNESYHEELDGRFLVGRFEDCTMCFAGMAIE